ncbi:CCT motif-containing protein [Carex littledalei]|uniref:CCT motif-containing protein n=1 Tax=Carex littledalei TaxID=544730 RepID=A0A833V820_9POAL|nr:CCT motif-containing protein [Carex littledalei]
MVLVRRLHKEIIHREAEGQEQRATKMQEKLMRQEQVDEAEMSIDEMISSPIAQHLIDFCDDGGGGSLFPIGDPSPAVSSTDVAGSSTTTTTTTEVMPPTHELIISAAYESFPMDDVDFATIESILDTQPQPQLQTPTQQQQPQQQQLVHPSINFNNIHPPQLINTSDFSPDEDNQTKAPEEMSNPPSQFLMRAPPNLIQVAPMQIQQQGGLMGIDGGFPLPMIQQNNTDRQRFFHTGNSSNGMAIPELGGMISPFGNEGREQLRRIFSSSDLQVIRGSQNIMAGCNESNAPPVLASTEPTSAALEESSSYKVGRLTQEERKAKIDRKTLADSRPRVRGRFAKNDEFEEPMRRSYSTGAYDDDGTSPMVPVKEDEDVHDSSDILAQINSMNSINFGQFYTMPPNTSSTWTRTT